MGKGTLRKHVTYSNCTRGGEDLIMCNRWTTVLYSWKQHKTVYQRYLNKKKLLVCYNAHWWSDDLWSFSCRITTACLTHSRAVSLSGCLNFPIPDNFLFQILTHSCCPCALSSSPCAAIPEDLVMLVSIPSTETTHPNVSILSHKSAAMVHGPHVKKHCNRELEIAMYKLSRTVKGLRYYLPCKLTNCLVTVSWMLTEHSKIQNTKNKQKVHTSQRRRTLLLRGSRISICIFAMVTEPQFPAWRGSEGTWQRHASWMILQKRNHGYGESESF